MLRFVPDGWLQLLLRPLILADPIGGVYFELPAPDARFFALVVLLTVAAVLWKRRVITAPASVPVLAVGLVVNLYVWTAVTGNGRYFAWGLLAVGPLVVGLALRLSRQPARRWSLVAAIVGLQVLLVHDFYDRNTWGLVQWKDGRVPVASTPLRDRPAVFVTISGISYSILVPWFHAESRWMNVAGQRPITAAAPEYPRLQAALASDLPRYLVVPASSGPGPGGPLREMIGRVLSRYGLALAEGPCELLATTLSAEFEERGKPPRTGRGFWICPMVHASNPEGAIASTQRADARFEDVFDHIEQACPRFFPPGDGKRLVLDDGTMMRHYPASDMRLYVDRGGRVAFKYFRALNPTVVGTATELLAGRALIDCNRIAGRYEPPWERGWKP